MDTTTRWTRPLEQDEPVAAPQGAEARLVSCIDSSGRLERLVLLLALAAAVLQPCVVPALECPPAPARWLTDSAGVLSPAVAVKIDQDLELFEKEVGPQLLVVIYRRLPEGVVVEDWTVRCASAWGVGHKETNDGAVLFAFVDDRLLRLEVGYGLEDSLTDLKSRDVLEEVLIPNIRRGDWDSGIAEAVVAIMSTILSAPPADKTATPSDTPESGTGVGSKPATHGGAVS